MRALGLLLLLPWCVALANAPAPGAAESSVWLKKVYHASQNLSYSGTFVYRQGERSETSRITRLVDAGGAVEKLEALDGAPREIVRKGDEVKCYLPDIMTIKVDRRSNHRSFPSLLPAQFASLSEHYTITKDEMARVAGFACQTIMLKPKDDLRYGYKLWADAATGLLLKARIFNEKGETVEEFTFTQLTVGGSINRERLKPKPLQAGKQWRVEDAAVTPAKLAESGWSVTSVPTGFQKVTEVRRNLRQSHPVGQIVFSDGLAAVSVFIESMQGREEPVHAGLSNMGAVNIFTREIANHLVTVVGEAPAATVRRIGERVEYNRRP